MGRRFDKRDSCNRLLSQGRFCADGGLPRHPANPQATAELGGRAPSPSVLRPYPGENLAGQLMGHKEVNAVLPYLMILMVRCSRSPEDYLKPKASRHY